MATTHTHSASPAHHRRHEHNQQKVNYAVIWGLIIAALIAVVGYGIYSSERAELDPSDINPTQAMTPVGEGARSSMIGTGPSSNELTPSTTEPGTPDTTTTESSMVPMEGVQ